MSVTYVPAANGHALPFLWVQVLPPAWWLEFLMREVNGSFNEAVN